MTLALRLRVALLAHELAHDVAGDPHVPSLSGSRDAPSLIA